MRTKLRENFQLILFSLSFALKDTVNFEVQLADEQTKEINSSKMEVTSTTASFSANFRSRKTVSFSEGIMTADKHPSKFFYAN